MSFSKLSLAIVLALATLVGTAPAQSPDAPRLSSPVSKDHAFGRGAEKFRKWWLMPPRARSTCRCTTPTRWAASARGWRWCGSGRSTSRSAGSRT